MESITQKNPFLTVYIGDFQEGLKTENDLLFTNQQDLITDS